MLGTVKWRAGARGTKSTAAAGVEVQAHELAGGSRSEFAATVATWRECHEAHCLGAATGESAMGGGASFPQGHL